MKPQPLFNAESNSVNGRYIYKNPKQQLIMIINYGYILEQEILKNLHEQSLKFKIVFMVLKDKDFPNFVKNQLEQFLNVKQHQLIVRAVPI